jgi:glycine cleavage system H protein
MYPNDLKYTKEHEWAKVDGKVVTVGVTHYAQDSLGDVVFIDLPAPGTVVTQFGKFGEIESVKAVSELFSPVGGKVVAVNDAAKASPEVVNSDPYGKGWLIKVEVSDAAQVKGLMDSEAYRKLVGAQ